MEDKVIEGAAFNYKTIDWKNKATQLATLLIFSLLVGVVWISFLLTAAGGISILEFYQKYVFYGVMITTCSSILGLLAFLSITTKGKIDTVIHDPEQSVLKDFKFFYSPINTAIIFLIMGCIVGLVSVFRNTFFVGVPQSILPEIVINSKEWIKIFFAAEPAAITETLLFMVLLSITNTGLNYVFKNKKMGGISEKSYLFVTPLLILCGGFMWMLYHMAAYGGQDAALLNVFIFGAVGVGLTILFNSFIPWWALHTTANAFLEINTIYSDDIATVFTIISVLVLILILILSLTIKSKLKK